jgi:hypothetical protein
MKTLNIQITQDDIDIGQQSCPLTCAIAKAFKRLFDGLHVELYDEILYIHDKEARYIIHNTPVVKGLIISFDICRSSISPQTLTFEIPDDIYEKFFFSIEETKSIPTSSNESKSTDIVRQD